MDRLIVLLEKIRVSNLAAGLFRGFLHVFIGRTIKSEDGQLISKGMTWRDMSLLLKQLKFDKELVRELGADPETISPRDREKFWYSVISLAKPDTLDAIAQADRFIALITPMGYDIGPIPIGLNDTKADLEKKAAANANKAKK